MRIRVLLAYVFHRFVFGENLQKVCRELQITKRILQEFSTERFLRSAGGRLVARPLYPVENASDRVLNATIWEFLLTWFESFLDTKEYSRLVLKNLWCCSPVFSSKN